MPAAHRLTVALVLPAGQEYPGAHGPVQDDVLSPGVDPYLPDGHDPLHRLEVCPVELPYLPAGHGAVHRGDDRPVEEPYKPASQAVHTVAPTEALYLPAGQEIGDDDPPGQ